MVYPGTNKLGRAAHSVPCSQVRVQGPSPSCLGVATSNSKTDKMWMTTPTRGELTLARTTRGRKRVRLSHGEPKEKMFAMTL